MSPRTIFLLGLGLLIGLGAITVAMLLARPYAYHGSVFDPPVEVGDFTLTDQNGQSFHLSEQRGKLVLMFFGYTNCPDVCPATLVDYQRIKTMLGTKAKQVRFVFITVDPERDTPPRIREYLAKFDPAFIGLTGDHHAMEPVWRSYGVYQEIGDHHEAEINYEVDHSSYVYVIDRQGELRLTFPFGVGSEGMAQDVGHLLKEK